MYLIRGKGMAVVSFVIATINTTKRYPRFNESFWLQTIKA